MQPDSNTNSPTNGYGNRFSKTDTAGRALSGASREFHDVLSDIEDLIKSTTSLTGEDLNRAKAKLNARVTDAKNSLQDMGGGMVDQARETADRTNVYVHDQPWQAIGIGAGVGLLAGIMLARRS